MRTAQELKDEIQVFAESIGIDKVGFASASPFVTLKARLKEQQRLNYQSGFEEDDIEKRTHPELLLTEATTIISIALAYPTKLPEAPKNRPGARRGQFCRASWGKDYHDVLRDKLNQLEAFIQETVPGAECKSMVDTGELSDRAVAERAGIGWSGKNCAIITPEFGSYVYLGEMITTLYLPEDTPLMDQCGTCNRCVDLCPTDALIQGGQLDAKKCIAYLTQTKEALPERYRHKLGNRLYGCDTCQQVCPENKGVDFHNHPEFEPDPEVVKPLLEPLLTISNREFKEKFGYIAGSWRGKKPIQRNALIALGHMKEKSSIPTIIQLLHNDPRPVIRGACAWALGEMPTQEGAEALHSANSREEEAEVLEEITKALDKTSPERV